MRDSYEFSGYIPLINVFEKVEATTVQEARSIIAERHVFNEQEAQEVQISTLRPIWTGLQERLMNACKETR